MNPILFSIGSLKFYTFGLITLAGVLAGVILTWFVMRKTKTKVEPKIDAIILTAFMGIIGARICFFLLNYYRFQNFEEMFYYAQDGLVAWGGIIAASLFAFALCEKYDDKVWIWLDNLMIGLFGGLFAGNLLNDILQNQVWNDYRLFWFLVTIGYLIYLRRTKLKKDLNGYLYLFGLLSFSLSEVALPDVKDGVASLWQFNFSVGFSLGMMILVIAGLIPIVFHKSWRIIIFQWAVYEKNFGIMIVHTCKTIGKFLAMVGRQIGKLTLNLLKKRKSA